jgi:transposase
MSAERTRLFPAAQKKGFLRIVRDARPIQAVQHVSGDAVLLKHQADGLRHVVTR